ncbi:MAG: hypothetical protein LBR11_06770 [Deltaproteobacteria bacterium]|jgi:hypothetical protein|nr:hypothetical protein [Deltaproteobacteria bacterium]
MSWKNNPREILEQAQRAQNTLAEFNHCLGVSLYSLADSLKLRPWFWEPALDEVSITATIPVTLRPVWSLSGTGLLPLSNFRQIFATRDPLSEPPTLGKVILVAHVALNRALVGVEVKPDNPEAVFQLDPGPALLRIHLYKVVKNASRRCDTLEYLWYETAEYGETPGWADSGVKEMAVWRGDFDLARFLVEPEEVAQAIQERLSENIPNPVN